MVLLSYSDECDPRIAAIVQGFTDSLDGAHLLQHHILETTFSHSFPIDDDLFRLAAAEN